LLVGIPEEFVEVYSMIPLDPTSQGDGNTVPNNQDLPKEMDVFYKALGEFLPPGKTFSDLTEAEKAEAMNKYRFSYMRPGIYQAITRIGNKNNNGGLM